MGELYQHINFVEGGVLKPTTKPEHNKEQYLFHSQEIVMPVFSPAWEYLIMHTPAVYNWLRSMHLNQDRINRYLKGEKPFHGNQKDVIIKIKELSTTWDVVQLCFTGKFYITKNESKECHHLTKRVVNSLDYTYNYPKKEMYLERYYCVNCQQMMTVEATAKRYPVVVMLKRYEERLYVGKEEYRLYLVIVSQEKGEALIKIANGAWYSVEAGSVKIRTEAQVKAVKGVLYFYQKVMESGAQGGPLKLAKPSEKEIKQIIKPEPIPMQIQQPTLNLDKQDDQPQYKPRFFRTELKPLPNTTYTPQTYTDMPSYTKSIKSLYNKQKKKDEYDKEYDAGKVKKIKKKKVIHKIDFNRTETDVKAGNIKVVSKKNKFRKEKHDRQL